jgi:type II secretory pathway predicted ATPase ExeA
MQENPFRPTFGIMPPEIIGRQRQIDDFIEALSRGIGHPHRSTIFVGARGMGKTVLLSEVGKLALEQGWIPVEITVNPNMLDDALDQINVKAEHLIKTGRMSLSGISAAGFGVNLSVVDQEPLGWRQKVTEKIEQLAAYETGVVFLVDEIHADESALKVLLTAYQHLSREERKVAIAMAGLPSAVSSMLNVDVITFIRRAHRETLTNISLDEVAQGLKDTFEDYGKLIDDDALRYATTATEGYPFLIQMIGFQIWELSGSDPICLAEAKKGVTVAQEYMERAVHEPALADLSAMDRKFLIAMSVDNKPSKAGDIAQRLAKSLSYAAQYRKRLIDAGLIMETSYGHVDFALPLLREYLRKASR